MLANARCHYHPLLAANPSSIDCVGPNGKQSPMDVMHYVQIAVLALIQGAAELLPVSSSAHVILAQRVMGMDPSKPEQVFLLVMLHTGTMFAVLVYFWPRWRRLLTGRSEAAAGEIEDVLGGS